MTNVITDKRKIMQIVSMHEKGLKYTVDEEVGFVFTIEKIVPYREADDTLWAAIYCKGKILTRVPLANFAIVYDTKGML